MRSACKLVILATAVVLVTGSEARTETKEEQDKAIAIFKKLNAEYKLDKKSIVTINLSLRNVSDKSMPTLVKPFTKCRELGLGETKITDATLEMIKDFHDMEAIVLDNTKITAKGLENLKEMKKLRILSLNGCKIGDDGLALFKDLNLRELGVAKTDITDKSVEVIKGYKGLEVLAFYKVEGVTDKGFEEIKKALPKLKKIDSERK